ncbi:MAG TPA: cupin domain-containing protein [Rhizobiaceae bacterium]|nr:cupin domain-containing protein [Rhizobiaceae bacterium]
MDKNFNLTPDETGWKAIVSPNPPAFSQKLTNGREDQPYRLAVWRGEPGRYKREAGMPWSETYVVYKGMSRITFAHQQFDLSPGTIVELRKGEPFEMEIFSTIEKVAVITE